MITVNEARFVTKKAIETHLANKMIPIHAFLDCECDRAITLAASSGLTSCTVEIPTKIEQDRHLLVSLLENMDYKTRVFTRENRFAVLIIWG